MTAVRVAGAGDYPAVRALGDRVVPETYRPLLGDEYAARLLVEWWSEPTLGAAMAAGQVVVAEAGGSVLGMAQVGSWDGEPVLWKLYVEPGRRGQGIGPVLIEAAIGLLPAGTPRLLTEHVSGNARAAAFYQREGFDVASADDRTVWRARVLPDPGAAEKTGIAGVFDRAAVTYDQVGVPFFGPAGEELASVAALAPGERLLDAGCGRGASLLPAAAAVGPRGLAVGLDLAPAMVAAARARTAGLPQVTVHVGDAEDPVVPELPDGSVDVVQAGLVLLFLPDPARAVRRWARLLRPGGRLAVSTFQQSSAEDEAAYRTLVGGVLPLLPPGPPAAEEDRPPPGRRLLTRESVAQLLAPAGFTGLRFVERDYPITFDSPEQHLDWAMSHGMRGLFEAVPADRAEEATAVFLTAARHVPRLTYRVRFTAAVRTGP